MVEESVDRGELYKLIPIQKSTFSSATTAAPATKQEGFSNRYNKSKQEQEAAAAAEEPKVREKKIENFSEIENIYDKGVIGNLREVFFPPKFD